GLPVSCSAPLCRRRADINRGQINYDRRAWRRVGGEEIADPGEALGLPFSYPRLRDLALDGSCAADGETERAAAQRMALEVSLEACPELGRIHGISDVHGALT